MEEAEKKVPLIVTYAVFSKLNGIKVAGAVGGFGFDSVIRLSGSYCRNGLDVTLGDIMVGATDANLFAINDGIITCSRGIDGIERKAISDIDSKKRMHVKTMKLLSLLRDRVSVTFAGEDPNENYADLREKFVTRTLELIVDKLKPITESEILVSDDVLSVYKMGTADKNTGTLGNSCMRPESSTKYHGSLYLKNYNKIKGLKIAYINNSLGLLVARALLWTDVDAVVNGEEVKITFLDRIYGADEKIGALKDWAEKRGYYSKREQTYRNNTVALGALSTRLMKLDTGLMPVKDLDGMPFMDTMQFISGSVLSTYVGGFMLDSTDNDFSKLVECPHCGLYSQSLVGVHSSGRTRRGCESCAVDDYITDSKIFIDESYRFYFNNGVRYVKGTANPLGEAYVFNGCYVNGIPEYALLRYCHPDVRGALRNFDDAIYLEYLDAYADRDDTRFSSLIGSYVVNPITITINGQFVIVDSERLVMFGIEQIEDGTYKFI